MNLFKTRKQLKRISYYISKVVGLLVVNLGNQNVNLLTVAAYQLVSQVSPVAVHQREDKTAIADGANRFGYQIILLSHYEEGDLAVGYRVSPVCEKPVEEFTHTLVGFQHTVQIFNDVVQNKQNSIERRAVTGLHIHLFISLLYHLSNFFQFLINPVTVQRLTPIFVQF